MRCVPENRKKRRPRFLNQTFSFSIFLGHTQMCDMSKVCTISFERREASLNVYSLSAIIGLSLLNSILMARFLKQSFAQTCLKETDSGKLQQFNYSRSLITNRGTVERGRIHSAHANHYDHCHG